MYRELYAEFSKIAETVPPEELEVIAQEVLAGLQELFHLDEDITKDAGLIDGVMLRRALATENRALNYENNVLKEQQSKTVAELDKQKTKTKLALGAGTALGGGAVVGGQTLLDKYNENN